MMGGNSSIIPIGGPLKGKTSFLCYAAETALAWSLEVLKQQPRLVSVSFRVDQVERVTANF